MFWVFFFFFSPAQVHWTNKNNLFCPSMSRLFILCFILSHGNSTSPFIACNILSSEWWLFALDPLLIHSGENLSAWTAMDPTTSALSSSCLIPTSWKYQPLTQQLGSSIASSLPNHNVSLTWLFLLLGILWVWGKGLWKLPLQTTGFSDEGEDTAFQAFINPLDFKNPWVV